MRDLSNPSLALRAPQLVVLAMAAAVVVLLFRGTFSYLYGFWQRAEYSHGFVIPLISAYLLWRQRARFAQLSWRTSWSGVALALVGLALYFLGRLGSITTLDAYALVIVIAGCVLGVMGWEAFKVALAPIALLFLMNPVPRFFYNNLSLELQLLSSQLGVALMRLFGVSVFLEGNVIDLGNYKLQVAEACSGLNYLFPLMTLGVIIAYLFKGKTWMRWCLFLSTIPITAVMNSFRVGVIGILVDRFGIEQAEGFLHWFEGWVIFMTCVLLMFAEMWVLTRVTQPAKPFRDIFNVDFGVPVPSELRASWQPPRSAMVTTAIAMILATTVGVQFIAHRDEIVPQRQRFASF